MRRAAVPLRRALMSLAALLLALLGTAAPAHEMSIAEMSVREMSPGDLIWQWTAIQRGAAEAPVPVWPAHCTADGNLLRCGREGLKGTVAMQGVGQRYSAVLMKVHWVDGQSSTFTLTGSQPEARLHGSAVDRRDAGEIASAYGVLGVEHILGGFDHLLFVFALLFLVGFQRRLVATITAFTLAHSLTLASSALGWLTLRPPPVEAAIALSILLVAAEALSPRPTLARRWPALVAFLFGLLHGLGFAGALKEIGLPDSHLTVALLSFNLGVEAGQLLAVGAAWALVLGLRRVRAAAAAAPRLRTALLYVIGTLAAYWSWGRVAAIFG